MSLFTDGKVHIMDGAIATRMTGYGMQTGDYAPVWIYKHPEAYQKVAHSYIENGAELLYAPTFGAIAPQLKKHRARIKLRELNTALVTMAKESADGRPVGGTISPTGLTLSPFGDTDFEDLIVFFSEQVAALDEAGVDFFVIETQTSLAECRAAVIAVRSLSDKPILVSFTCGETGRTPYGENLNCALLCLQDMGVSAFGINCCGSLGRITRLLNGMTSYARIPLLAKPKAGEVSVSLTGRQGYRMSPLRPASSMPHWIEAGARFIGGCCGTDERFIAAMCDVVDTFPVPITTERESVSYAASAYRVQKLSPRLHVEDLEINDDLAENANICEETGTRLLHLHLRDEESLDILEDAQFYLQLPIAVSSEDASLLSGFLRRYHGKPIIL